MKRRIVIKTDFVARHEYPDNQNPKTAFLKHPHRHKFYVTMKFDVSHNNREIEFFEKLAEVEEYIGMKWANRYIGFYSCEMIADSLLHHFGAAYVSVFEDNENGAEIEA